MPMVLINNVKYACERCIRGHRVTTCNHTDQPLMMIKPKGRPSTTCDHCKELRKNKNANPSGVCTCGRLEKKRLAQKAKEEARAKAKEEKKNHDCRCDKNEPCKCHSSRRRSRKISMNDAQLSSYNSATSGHVTSPVSVETYNDNYIDSDGTGKISKDYHHIPSLASISSLHSTHSLDQKFNFPQSPTLGNFGGNGNNGHWDNSSICSSARSDSRANLSDIMGAGLDPSISTKRAAPTSRSRVGEVTVPLEEYIPSDINGIGRINDVNSFDDWSPEASATNMNPSVSATYAQSNSNSINHQAHSHDQIRSESISNSRNNGLLDMFLDSSTMPVFQDKNNSASLGLAKRYSFHSPQDAHNHYKDNNNIKTNHTANNSINSKPWDGTEGSLDNESVRSVEVLSLTPSFMDIPERKPSHPSHHQLTHRHSNDSQVLQQRSSSVSRNQRYGPVGGSSYISQPPMRSPPVTVNPTNVSNVDDNVSLNSLQSPSASIGEHGLVSSSTDPSLLKNLPETIRHPRTSNMLERSSSTQFQQTFQWSQPPLPRQGSQTLSNPSDVNSEIDQLMAFDTSMNGSDSMSTRKEGDNPLFQDANMPYANPLVRRSLQDTSPASSNQTSSPPSQLLTEKGFADLDNFMSIL